MINNYKSKELLEYVDRYVGSRVRLRRLLLGLSKAQLGKAMGIDAAQVRKYEKGTSKIYGADLHRLGECLNVQVSYFFEKAEDKVEQNLLTDSMNFVVNEREIIPLVKAYQDISDVEERRKVSDLIRLFADDL